MLSKKEINKLVKSILRRQRGLRDHQIIHPRRDWMVGFLVGILLLVAGGTWSFVTYQEVGERDVDSVDIGEIRQTVYREDLVNAALERFRERKENHEALLNQNQSSEITPQESAEEEEPVETEEVVIEESAEEEVDNEPETTEEVETSEEEQPVGPPTDAPDVESGA